MTANFLRTCMITMLTCPNCWKDVSKPGEHFANGVPTCVALTTGEVCELFKPSVGMVARYQQEQTVEERAATSGDSEFMTALEDAWGPIAVPEGVQMLPVEPPTGEAFQLQVQFPELGEQAANKTLEFNVPFELLLVGHRFQLDTMNPNVTWEKIDDQTARGFIAWDPQPDEVLPTTYVPPKRLVKPIWNRVTSKVISSVDVGVGQGIPCEIEYFDDLGREIGYWAYGSFDPNGPYRE